MNHKPKEELQPAGHRLPGQWKAPAFYLFPPERETRGWLLLSRPYSLC